MKRKQCYCGEMMEKLAICHTFAFQCPKHGNVSGQKPIPGYKSGIGSVLYTPTVPAPNGAQGNYSSQ